MRKMLDLVIPDAGPLITFALIDRLDLLDRFNCAVMITDMVSEELLRGPAHAPDKAVFEQWFARRGNRLQTVDTTYGDMWEALDESARRKIKRLHPGAGKLSIREFTDKVEGVIPTTDQVLVLFEEDSVKRMHFGPQLHLLHTFALLAALENLGVVASADDLVDEIRRRGRNLARDPFERRAALPDDSQSDCQPHYDRGVEETGG
ncbi:MAG TPA: hypothetical protein VK446_06360 [Methylocystis sp.]|nr:hypothetical protein [Methylocystis sp.]